VNLGEQLCPWLEQPYRDLARAAAAGRLGHAWIIAGRPGLGKLNLAFAFARHLLEGEGARPAAATPSAILAAMRDRHLPSDHHPDLHLVFPEEQKKSIGVEQIRSVSESLMLTGFKGVGKVAIIEPAEAMTVAAANALLKLLEEPTRDTYLFLVAHRPGRLPSTIRSRCHTCAVHAPSAADLEAWLGPDAGRAGIGAGAHAVADGMTPLTAAARIEMDYLSISKELEESINLVYEDRIEPLVVADQWLKQDLPLVLDWLIARIEGAIRGRVASHGSNRITVQSAPVLQNGWDKLTLDTLFEQRRAAQALEDQLGGGINAELALRALLLGFLPDRGR
jgi:DNA polymerase-3 subunit delta'